MARTNKRGIAQKKAAQQKAAARFKGLKRFDYPKRRLELDQAKELGVVGIHKNPKGGEYHRFMRGRKICRETRLRVDPDGYRMIKTPSGWSEIVQVMLSGWTRKRLNKTLRAK